MGKGKESMDYEASVAQLLRSNLWQLATYREEGPNVVAVAYKRKAGG